MTQNKNYRILIVDDEIEYQKVVSIILEDAGYHTDTCSGGAEALDFLKDNVVDLVITDLRMPGMSGNELIRQIVEMDCGTDILVVTAFGSIEGAVDSMKLGASDYFVKSNDLDELLLKIGRIERMRSLERKSDILLRNQDSEKVFLGTKNTYFQNILEMCNRTADTNINILLLGESGVGKEVIANYIHRISQRKNEPFIPVNCQVFPEGLIDSELFGHEKGAFTGAVLSRVGKFEEANDGTLFLDEIGDLPMTTQGKLLRVLETRSIERIGSNKKIDLDVRFISATNKNISQKIMEGAFREDLLYRINTLTLTIPPLRERREDIPGLIDFFVRKIEADQKKKDVQIDGKVMDYLLSYDYPGNVRELKNIIERLIALSRNGTVTMSELFMPFNMGADAGRSGGISSLKEERAKFEKRYIVNALEISKWNVTRCAAELGITSRQLWNKINQYGIKNKEIE
ncbi:sigma-54-dependent transcriptional regulator [Bacilliculturomica massiliensis]|uniref:sigma-54-dependent transcriptional regulator n=1 Tax=Bacilliculturomica massiliensis TaxID=1917867 RepID=UPI00102F76AF|nr:sigma-54 dependent transcriptional regulator [Bacilliculturomica massiliensis]